MNSGSVYNTPRDYDDRRLHQFLYQSEPIDHSTKEGLKFRLHCMQLKFEEIRGVKQVLYTKKTK